MNSNYKDLFLGIRQYDSNLSNETLKRLIEIAHTAPNNKNYPGYQNTDLFELGEISIDLLERDFVECVKDYFKFSDDKCPNTSGAGMRMWFHQDWKYNPRTLGNYWHDHHDNNYYGMSGVMYLTLPETSHTTGFSLDAKRECLDTFETVPNMQYLPRLKNKWFLFPNWMPHLPGKNETEERRICVEADFWFR